MIIEPKLDVTTIEPRLKHPTIFRHFDALEPGEGFIIENDHDPKPLYYELIGERGNIFTWEYLEKGPEWFIVQITKIPESRAGEDTVGAIAAADIRKAEILKTKGIDFGCGGNKTLKQAGEEIGMTEEELRIALSSVGSAPVAPSVDYNKWDLDFLSDYIINTHHRYLKDNATLVADLATKVAEHHGDNHPELRRLASSINNFLTDQLAHLAKEEKILFPMIKSAVAKKNGYAGASFESGNVRGPIQVMQREHQVGSEDLTYLRRLTGDYTLPEDACNSYRYLFEKLKELEDDFHIHIHLENNILFPKAVKLDTELSA